MCQGVLYLSKKNLLLEPNRLCKYCQYFEIVDEEGWFVDRKTYYCNYYEVPVIIDGYWYVKTACPKFERKR